MKLKHKLLIIYVLSVVIAIILCGSPASAHIKCPEGITLNILSVPNPFVFTLNANGETYTRTFTHDEFIAIINSGE